MAQNKFHINPATGKVGRCMALLENGNRISRGCPFGSPEEHFDSPEEARVAYEVMASKEFTTFGNGAEAREAAREAAVTAKAARIQAAADRIKTEAMAEAARYDAETKGFDRVSVPRLNRGTVASAASNLMGSYGAKSYEETIKNAKERAGYASAYYDTKAAKHAGSSSFLEANSSTASAAVAARTSSAIGARSSSSIGVDRVLAHATPSANPEAARDALAARGDSKSTSIIGSIGKRFGW